MSTKEEIKQAINNLVSVYHYLELEADNQERSAETVEWELIRKNESIHITNVTAQQILLRHCIKEIEDIHHQEIQNNRYLQNDAETVKSLNDYKTSIIGQLTEESSDDLRSLYFRGFGELQKKVVTTILQYCGIGWEWLTLLVLCRKWNVLSDNQTISFISQKTGVLLNEKNNNEEVKTNYYLWYQPNKRLINNSTDTTSSIKGVKPDLFISTVEQLPSNGKIHLSDEPIFATIECKASRFSSASFFKLWGQARYLNAKKAVLLPFKERVASEQANYIIVSKEDDDLTISIIGTPNITVTNPDTRREKEQLYWSEWSRALLQAISLDL